MPPALRRVHVGLLALLGALTAPTGSAAEPPVAVGEVRGSTPNGEFSAPLRHALTEGVASLTLGTSREHFVLSATLVSLSFGRFGRIRRMVGPLGWRARGDRRPLRLDSNQRPPAFWAGALPAELLPLNGGG